MSTPSAILWEAGELRLLDQRQLPHRVEYLRIDGIPDAVEAIATLARRARHRHRGGLRAGGGGAAFG